MDLKDTILNVKLTNAGLPIQAVTSSSIGEAPPSVDPYAPSASSLVQLSGYGRALSAVSQFSNSLQTTPTQTFTGISSTPGVVTTPTSTSSTTGATYNVDVTQLAQAQQSTSAYFGDPAAAYFSPGNFSIQSSSGTTSVTVGTGSLNGIASAINSANAGVTAAVQSDSFGYKLVLTGVQTGAANTFSVTASPSDPFGWNKDLGTLALSQSQASGDASYSVNSTPATSASNQNIAISTGVTANLIGVGTSQITIAPNYQSALSNAQGLISQYNVLRGNINQLTGTSGQLNGDSTGTQLSTDLYNTTQATLSNPGSALTTFAQLGITAASQTSPLSLNTTTLTSAFNSDPLGTSNLLDQIRQSFTNLAQSYGGASGALQTQSNTVMTNILQGIQTVLGSGSGVPQSAGINIYQNELLFNSMQSQYSGISLFV